MRKTSASAFTSSSTAFSPPPSEAWSQHASGHAGRDMREGTRKIQTTEEEEEEEVERNRVCVCVCVCVGVCGPHTHTHIQSHTHGHIRTCTDKHTYTHIQSHTHAHIRTCTHIHTPWPKHTMLTWIACDNERRGKNDLCDSCQSFISIWQDRISPS